MNFSSRFSRAIKSAGLTQLALAKAAGVRQSAISNYCKGNGLPSAEALYALSKVLNVSMEWLISGEGEEIQNSDTWQQRALEAEGKLAELKEVLPLLGKANSMLAHIVSK